MSMRKLLSVLLLTGLVLVASLGMAACGEGEEEAPQLGASHPGYLQPACWTSGCHSAANTHNAQKDPFECAACHGNNGAPNRHEKDAGCDGCHSPLHASSGFPVPTACLACHRT